MNATRWMMIPILMGLTAGGCLTEKPRYTGGSESCPGGELIEFEGVDFCLLIEEGFLVDDCPEAFPNGEEVEGVIVCAEEEVPDNIDDGLREKGYLDPLDVCDAIEEAYSDLTAQTACEVDADCQVLMGQCGQSLGGCDEIVNRDVTQDQLSELGRRYSDEGCSLSVCDCAEPPEAALCQAGRCVAQETLPPTPCPSNPESILEGDETCADPGLACEYGEECCCGRCSPSLVCECEEDGTFSCFFTDACLDPECSEDGPVCAGRGFTLQSAEAARERGLEIHYEGECRDCATNADCNGGEFCRNLDGICALSQRSDAVCIPRPEDCNEDAPGACGCDGQVHANTCLAAADGVDTVTFGGCGNGDTFICGEFGDRCQKGAESCGIFFNDVIGENEPPYFANCAPLPDECDAENPTCDCLGIQNEFDGICYEIQGQLIVLVPGG